jgi:hypothetical protein
MSMSSAYEIDDPVPPPRIDVGKMADALWEADYKLMSLIVDGALYDILFPIRYGALYDNQIVTVFAPPDDVFRFDNRKTTVFYVVVSSEVDTHSSIDFLFTCAYTWRYTSHELTVVKVPDGRHSWMNNINITRSNIYNDGRMIVHGVDKLFSLS